MLLDDVPSNYMYFTLQMLGNARPVTSRRHGPGSPKRVGRVVERLPYTYNVGHTVGEDIIAVLISRGETVSQHVSIDVLCGRYGR